MDETHVWLSPQGRSPVLVARALLEESASPLLRRMFDPRVAPPPTLPAYEVATGGAPVYLIDVPEAILTMLTNILSHPQLAYHYSVDNGPEAFVRRAYLKYYDLYTTKQLVDDGEKKKQEEDEKKKQEEDKAFDKACLELYKKISTEHPLWDAFMAGRINPIKMEFINTYKHGVNDSRTDYITIDGKQQSIAWYFFMRGVSKDLRCCTILKSQYGGNTLNSTVRWERDVIYGDEKAATRTVEHWPAVTTGKTIDPRTHEIVLLTMFR
jgi:hypothetical protein